MPWLGHVRGNKWKAEWIEPNPGLVHYVESRLLVSTWREHKTLLTEEVQQTRLKMQGEQDGYSKGSPLDTAMYSVFEGVSDDVRYSNGVLSGSPEAMARVKTRAGVDVNKQSPGGIR